MKDVVQSRGLAMSKEVAGVTESCDCDGRVYASAWLQCTYGHYPPSALMMDGQLDVASTSDADERELLEAANSDLYWDHVIARSQVDPHRHLPSALPDQDDDM
jgi:hypothetical protein